jgi:uroporphyrinogen-III synthase
MKKVKKTKIAAFRPENLLPRTREIAERHGFDFFGFPVFELVARKEALSELEAVFKEGVDIAVFTSVNGVRKTFEICEGKTDLKSSVSSADVELCAIGPATKGELEAHGLNVDLMPAEYSAEGLKELFNAISVKDRRIVFLRSSEGNKELVNFLNREGAFVTDIAVYTMKKIDPAEFKEFFDAFLEFRPDYVIFTSSLTFKIFFELAKELDRENEIFKTAKIAAIGELTAETITEEGLKVDVVADKSTFEDLLNAIPD